MREKVRTGQPASIVQGDKAEILCARYTASSKRRERLVETYEILADDELMDKIRRSEEDIAQGRFISLEDFTSSSSPKPPPPLSLPEAKPLPIQKAGRIS